MAQASWRMVPRSGAIPGHKVIVFVIKPPPLKTKCEMLSSYVKFLSDEFMKVDDLNHCHGVHHMRRRKRPASHRLRIHKKTRHKERDRHRGRDLLYLSRARA